jgi:hypothetical protein
MTTTTRAGIPAFLTIVVVAAIAYAAAVAANLHAALGSLGRDL